MVQVRITRVCVCMRRRGAGLKIGEDGGCVFDFLWHVLHLLSILDGSSQCELLLAPARMVFWNPRVEAGESATIHLFDFSIRHHWLFLRFHLYPALGACLFLYFFEDLSRGSDDGARREISQFGMRDHPFNRGGGGFDWSGFGQVAAGDLQAVEEQTSAFGVDVAAGDALENLTDAALNGAAIFGHGQFKEVGGIPVFAKDFHKV
jgi:hypothetical protein